MDLQKDEDFEKSWQENRHIWESTKDLARAMFYAGQAKAQAVPEGFRVMNKSEFFNAYLQEEYGATEKFATPGSHEFTDEVIEMEPTND